MKKVSAPSIISNLPIPIEFVERRIYLIRGQKVMLDSDLAELYQVPTFRLNESVKRNKDRFPEDFMFKLTEAETQNLRSQFAISSLKYQIGTSNLGYGGRRYLPYAFTEHGVAMLSSVLNSKRAVQMNILIIRAFIQLREILASHKDVEQKIKDLERRQKSHGLKINVIYKIVEDLLQKPEPKKNPIGFRTN
jgi:hypothetical protein